MGISITVNAGDSQSTTTVNGSGTISNIITPDQVTLFGLHNAALNSAVEKYLGQAPDEAYLYGPTPWGDLFTSYNWPQVQVTASVQSATVLGITSSPAQLATQKFINTSSVPVEYTAKLSQQQTVSAETSWSSTSTLEISQKITYGVNFGSANVGGETALAFSESWGKGGGTSESLNVGADVSATFTLQPDQSATAALSASQGVMTVQIVYLLTLSGDTAVNYSNPYQGHHFYGLPIQSVVSAAGIPMSQTVTETIQINYCMDAQITISDGTGAVLLKRPVAARAGASTTSPRPVAAKLADAAV